MGRYFSFEAVAAACRVLRDAGISSTHLSALRYCLALDAFAKEYGRDCSLKKGSQDKDLFIGLVGGIVSIDADASSPSYIDNFEGNKPKKDKLASQISSNFLTANAVRQSRGKSSELYPSGKNKYLFNVSDEVLEASSIKYEHISRYLPTVEARIAFAVWVARFDEMPDEATIAGTLKDALKRRFSKKLVDALLNGTEEVGALLGLSDEDALDSSRPQITWALLFPYGFAERPAGLLPEPHNLIFFGAPGTGKSYELNKLADAYFDDDHRTRVTFYPDYTYSQFVGCFKPTTEQVVDDEGNRRSIITYRYTLGPFLETYVQAIKHPEQNYLLIVEEINRANPAAVFGDVFQLLDRRADGCSEYTVAASEDMRGQLALELGDGADGVSKLAIPANMYIWATMNSADQGVFPMDTAFKRRWDFRYMSIDEGENADINGKPLSEIKVPCGGRDIVWNNLRYAINEFMASDDLKINEDKLLGPFFINPAALTAERFADVFKDKVLLYLYEDAGRTKRSKMFRRELNTYSKLCEAFDEEGEGIFGSGFDDHIVYGEPSETNTDIPEE